MRVLIIHASAGAGHTKAAEALFYYLKKRHPEIDVEIIDVLGKVSPLFKYSYLWGYFFLVNHAIFLWYLAFSITNCRLFRRLSMRIALAINRLNTRRFSEYLARENPDFIVSTHFLPSEVASSLKKSGLINSKLITVITDFGVHPFWISMAVDFYVAASEFARERLLEAGIQDSAIKVFGIPIAEKFFQVFDRAGIREKLKLDKNRFTVLIMIGSFGIGPIEKIVGCMQRDIQLIVVCAKNKGLMQRLNKKNLPNVKIFGFVDNVEELMAASDMVITKPGGLSISEILQMELAPIFISAIPGQETTNVEVLKKSGIGLVITKPRQIGKAVLDLKNDPVRLESLKENIRKIKKPFVPEEIYRVICQDNSGVAGKQ